MKASRDPRRPLRGGRKTRAARTSARRGKPLRKRLQALLEGRGNAARERRETARRERAAIDREKATARRQEAASSRGRGRRRLPPRAASAAAARPAGDAAGGGPSRAGSRARPGAQGAAARITAFGERSSKLLLAAAAPVVAVLLAAVGVAERILSRLAVTLTPLRAALAVTAIAALLLGVSQFVDYRGVAVGVQDYAAYSDVEPVAPAPQVDRQPAGEPHSYLLVPVAALALVLLVACARGRWQLGRVISLLGLAVIAVSVLIDAPAGLDEGAQALAYASVEAQLVEGFYVQLVCGAVLVAGGLLVTHYARTARRGRASARRRRGAAVRPLGARAA
jgi:hypothetical protein